MTFVHPYLRSIALVGAVGAIALTAVVDAQRDERRYGVAVVRIDGTIVPFAEYDRDQWRDLWTGVHRRSYEIPITLGDVDEDWWGHVDPSSVWQLWKRPGVSDVLTVTGIRPVSTPCSASVGLTTNYQPQAPPPPPDVAPYPKAGLATTAGITFEPIEPMAAGSREWALVRKALENKFEGIEMRQLVAMRWAHPMSLRERHVIPIDLKTVLHVPGSRFYYLEAMRSYPDPDPPDDAPPCGLVTYVSGFFWQNGRGELVPVSINTLVSYCHLEEAIYLWPLGVIKEGGKDGGRDYWVVQTAGWTGEAYGIIELDEEKGTLRDHLWHTAGQCGRR
jgi:hypothetical protein